MIKNYSTHIKKCIDETQNGLSLIHDPSILELSRKTYPHPMSTAATQSLINKLCSLKTLPLTQQYAKYLEVGVLNGASYFAAAHNNSGCFYGIDNWSTYGDRQEHIEKNIKKYSSENTKFCFFNEDSWELDLSRIKHKINIFFYDGDHSRQAQEIYLKHFDKILDDELILIVDDFLALDYMKKATEKCIKNSSFELAFDFELTGQEWHNGLYLAHLKR